MTLAHDYVADLAALGIKQWLEQHLRVPSLQPLADLHNELLGVLEGAELVGHGDGDVAMDGVPAARGEAEALVDRPELDEPFSVVEFLLQVSVMFVFLWF